MINSQSCVFVFRPGQVQPMTSRGRRLDRYGWAGGKICRPCTGNNSPLVEVPRPSEDDRTSVEAWTHFGDMGAKCLRHFFLDLRMS